MLVICHHAGGFWMRGKEEIIGEDVDDDFFMTVEDVGDAVFNSRGPRSIYRGLEEEADFVWEEEEEEEEEKFGSSLRNYFDY